MRIVVLQMDSSFQAWSPSICFKLFHKLLPKLNLGRDAKELLVISATLNDQLLRRSLSVVETTNYYAGH